MDTNVVHALIEIPLGSKNKYELNEEDGRIYLDRVLYASMIYPAEYGFVENTLAPDGDPLDILVICTEPTFPGCMVPARVLGCLSMVDNGALDYKLIAVVDCDPHYDHVHALDDLNPFLLKEIANFFTNYKVLQGIKVEVGQYIKGDDAFQIIDECRQRYLDAKAEEAVKAILEGEVK
ncbi:MAG: inorganic diphosphatase [Clostridiales bacterium]|nr:inorganic diphosphatase [Clostridiales bacterium]